MNEREQITVLNQLLIAIAPGIAIRALDRLSDAGDAYSDKPDESFIDARRRILEDHAELAIELASHLAGKFAQISDAALSSTQAQETPQKHQQGPQQSAADILSQPSGVSSEVLKLRAMRAAQHRGAP